MLTINSKIYQTKMIWLDLDANNIQFSIVSLELAEILVWGWESI